MHCCFDPQGQARHGAESVEYRVAQHVAKLGPRHRSSVVELSIRNRAVVGSNPTGGSLFSVPLLAFLGPPCPAPVPVALPWRLAGCRAATPRRSRAPISLLLLDRKSVV